MTAVMVDGNMRDDLLQQGKVDFSNIRANHNVVVYVSEKESDNPDDNPGDDNPVNPDNPDGHDPTPPDPTNPNKPGTPGNPGGIPGEKGDEKYLYVTVTTVGAGTATPSTSAKVNGSAKVAWTAARGHKVTSVTVDGIERLDLMSDLAKGKLSFENLQRSHNVVITFDRNPDYDPDAPLDPDDPNNPDKPNPDYPADSDSQKPDYDPRTTRVMTWM